MVGRLDARSVVIEKYRATVPSIAKHGGKYLVRGGKMETLEGRSDFVRHPRVPDDQAKAFYHDPAYAPFIGLRQSGST